MIVQVPEVYVDGVIRQRDDDVAKLHHFFDENGIELPSPASPIPYTPEEVAIADVRLRIAELDAERETLLEQLYAGVLQIEQARDAATADIANADNLNTQAIALKAAATTQKGQVAGFVAPATYSAATITTIRDALATVIARQETIIQAMADMYVYRKAVDQNAVITDNALLWLARLAADRILD